MVDKEKKQEDETEQEKDIIGSAGALAIIVSFLFLFFGLDWTFGQSLALSFGVGLVFYFSLRGMLEK